MSEREPEKGAAREQCAGEADDLWENRLRRVVGATHEPQPEPRQVVRTKVGRPKPKS